MGLTEFVLVASLATLVYTYAGYPMLLWMLALGCPRPVFRKPYEPDVTIIIVAYNEAARIARKLETCLALDYPKEKLHIIVGSDGSDDGTNEIVEGYAGLGVSLLAFPIRRGKAACLNDAVGRSSTDILVFTDARQRLDRGAVGYLAENFADASIGAVSGELEFETNGMSGFGEGVDSYWRYEKFIRQQESRLYSTVGVTGALYALRRECFRAIPADTILDDVLIPMNVISMGKRVLFDGRAKAFDLPSRDARQEKVRKVRTIAGNYQLLSSNPYLFLPWRNPIFIQLISHKVLRLVGPLLLAALLVSNIVLFPYSFIYQCLLSLQLAGYALALAGTLSPVAGRWMPVRIANAFFLLNWFAVLGALEFVRNRNAHLWDSKRQPGTG